MDAKQTPPTPFKGLFTYEATPADARLFFGREAEKEIVRANLMAFRLTVFYGPTGVGKSSLLNAGVVHPLREQSKQQLKEEGWPDFCVVAFREWRDDPARELVECVRDALEKGLGKSLDEVATGLKVRPDELLSPDDSLSAALRKLTERLGIDLLIILDQFEEYFVYHPREKGEGAFDAEFSRAVNDRSLRANFLISIREEWVAKLDRFKGPIPSIFDNNLRLKHLGRAAASAAISEPMRVYRQSLGGEGPTVGIPDEVAQKVLDDLQQYAGDAGPGDVGLGEASHRADSRPAGTLIQAPYLQLLMRELWDEQRTRDGSHLLQSETFEKLGGVDGVRRNYILKKMKQLSAAEQDIGASALRFLVTSSGTKYAQSLADLSRWSETNEAALAPVLDKLCGENFNILRRTVLRDSDDLRYELVHDLLAPPIHGWASEHNLNLKLARLRREEKEREKTRRLRFGFIGLAVMCLALAGVSVFAFQQRKEAVLRRREADQQRGEAERLREEEAKQRALAENSRDEADQLRIDAEEAQKDAEEQKQIAEARAAEARAAEESEKRARAQAEAAETVAKLTAKAEGLSRAGLSEIRSGHIKKALELFEEARKLYAQLDDRLGEAAAIANIGDAHATLGGIAPLSLIYEYFKDEEDFGGKAQLTGEAASRILPLLMEELRGKLTEEQKKELSAAREKALKQYKDALATYGDNISKEAAANRASVLKRLGDIYFFMADDKELKDNEKEKEYRQQGIVYYERAAYDHGQAGEHSDRGQTLRVVADVVSDELSAQTDAGERAKMARHIDELYREASESYQEAKEYLKQATVLFNLGQFHKRQPDGNETALTHLAEAHKILAAEKRPADEYKLATILADTYQELKRGDDAFRYYELALEAHLRAGSAPGTKREENAVPEYPLRNVVVSMLGASDNAEQREQQHARADQSFERLLKANLRDTSNRALLLDIISQTYTGNCTSDKPTDCDRIVKYLSQERDAWRALNNPTEEAITLFQLSEAYDREKNTEGAVGALDEAFRVRQGIAAAQPSQSGEVLLDANVRSGAQLYEKLGEYRKAAGAYSILLDDYLKSSAGASSFDSRLLMLTWSVAGNYLRQPDGAREAESIFARVLAASRRVKDTTSEIALLRAAGVLYGGARNLERARFYLGQERSLQLTRKSTGDALEILLLLSRLHDKAGDKAAAAKYLAEALAEAVANRDSVAEATARGALGDFYRDGGERGKAVAEYELAWAAYRAGKASPFLETKVVRELIKLYRKVPDEKKEESLIADLIKLHETQGAGEAVRDSLAELVKFYWGERDEQKQSDLVKELIKLHEQPEARKGVRDSLVGLVKFYWEKRDEQKQNSAVVELVKLHDRPGGGREVRNSMTELIEFFKGQGDARQERLMIEQMIKVLAQSDDSRQAEEYKKRLEELKTLQP